MKEMQNTKKDRLNSLNLMWNCVTDSPIDVKVDVATTPIWFKEAESAGLEF